MKICENSERYNNVIETGTKAGVGWMLGVGEGWMLGCGVGWVAVGGGRGGVAIVTVSKYVRNLGYIALHDVVLIFHQ
jgi:hypothetical protein